MKKSLFESILNVRLQVLADHGTYVETPRDTKFQHESPTDCGYHHAAGANLSLKWIQPLALSVQRYAVVEGHS